MSKRIPARLGRTMAVCTLASIVGCAWWPGDGSSDGNIKVSIRPQEPNGYRSNPSALIRPLRQDVNALELVPTERDGIYGLEIENLEKLDAIDIRYFLPRVPKLARGDSTLMKIALAQREFNRNQTTYPAAGGAGEIRLANNCLKKGLWEVMSARKNADGKLALDFHGWFQFPEEQCAILFERTNGISLNEYENLLNEFPKLENVVVPLSRLRTVESESALLPLENRAAESVQRFSEQQGKSILILGEPYSTYADFQDPSRQPIQTASFSEPGYYNVEKPVEFDLSWLGQPTGVVWRKVRSNEGRIALDEIEIRFANGKRILSGDSRIAAAPTRTEPPAKDGETIRQTFGICTPDIYATAEERRFEYENEPANYLLLLDAQDRYLDNHTTGIDRVYSWKEAGSPERLHLLLICYERIAVVAHYVVDVPSAK